jgi:hypothetical protein
MSTEKLKIRCGKMEPKKLLETLKTTSWENGSQKVSDWGFTDAEVELIQRALESYKKEMGVVGEVSFGLYREADRLLQFFNVNRTR